MLLVGRKKRHIGAAPGNAEGRARGWAAGSGDGTKSVSRGLPLALGFGDCAGPQKNAPASGRRCEFSEQFFGARLAQRVADRPGRVFAFADFGYLRSDQCRAVLALQLVALTLSGREVGNADQAAALLSGDGATQLEGCALEIPERATACLHVCSGLEFDFPSN